MSLVGINAPTEAPDGADGNDRMAIVRVAVLHDLKVPSQLPTHAMARAVSASPCPPRRIDRQGSTSQLQRLRDLKAAVAVAMPTLSPLALISPRASKNTRLQKARASSSGACASRAYASAATAGAVRGCVLRAATALNAVAPRLGVAPMPAMRHQTICLPTGHRYGAATRNPPRQYRPRPRLYAVARSAAQLQPRQHAATLHGGQRQRSGSLPGFWT